MDNYNDSGLRGIAKNANDTRTSNPPPPTLFMDLASSIDRKLAAQSKILSEIEDRCRRINAALAPSGGEATSGNPSDAIDFTTCLDNLSHIISCNNERLTNINDHLSKLI